MIYTVKKKPADERHIETVCGPGRGSFDYRNVIVKKPWGYEYLVFENEHVAIWMLQIVRKRRTPETHGLDRALRRGAVSPS